MKKSISIFILAIIILCALFPIKSYAETESGSTSYTHQNFEDVEKEGMQNPDTILKDDESTATVNGKQQKITETGNTTWTVAGVVIRALSYIPQTFQTVMSLVISPYVTDGGSAGTIGSSSIKWFTIQDTVFGKISLFDINFFDTSNKSGVSNNPNVIIKEQVANWFYIIRTISMIGALLVLIYTGIRMAISTVASDQAKYKQMLLNWFVSFVVLFILPYAMMLILNIADSFIKLIPQKVGNSAFEQNINTTVNDKLLAEEFLPAFGAFLTLILLTYYQVKFFFRYLVRFLKVAFLIIISPLITVTYALDKGSTHKKWFQQFISAVFIQAIHAIIYSIFIFSAAEIATKAPIVAIAFFMALSRGEKIFTYLFNIKGQD